MRLFHFSDTHLGHSRYSRLDERGLNQRQVDLDNAFAAVIDAAIREKPDLLIHAGDLFDGVRPGNRALAVALEGFRRAADAGIPVVCIAGNHETPRLRETGSPLRLLQHAGVHAAFQGHAETFPFTTRAGGRVRVHAVPQCADNAALAAEIAALRKPDDGGLDLLVVHGAVTSLPAFSHAEANEQELDPAWFDGRFDYVALGHYHGTKQVAERAWYCGAPERVSIAEAGEAKGFLDVRVDPGRANASFREHAARPMLDLPALDAGGLDAGTLQRLAIEAVAALPAGAIVRLRLQHVDPAVRAAFDARAVHKAAAHLLHLDLRIEAADVGLRAAGDAQFRGVREEFEAFAAQQTLPEGLRERVLADARRILEAPA